MWIMVLVASPRTEMLQRAFNILVDIFNRVGLHNNVRNMVSMAGRPCYTPGIFKSRCTRYV